MPLPSDDQLIATSQDVIAAFKTVFGAHPGMRPAHAKGAVIRGSFVPTPEAKEYSTAPHFAAPSTPIIGRFSSSTGLPQIPDTDPNANPRGFAIRFNLPDHDGKRVHTDVVTHSTPFFPTRTGKEFLDFLNALIASPAGTPSPSPIEQFLGSHPAALAHIQAPKPFPASFASESYFGVTALKFVDAAGKERHFRFRIIPTIPVEVLTDAQVAEKSPTYLFDELPAHLAKTPISFKLVAQIAEEGDVVDDATVHWPETRKLVDLGSLTFDSVVEESDKVQKSLIFDPIPRVQGLEPSADPLLEFRAAMYLISGRERRAA